MNGDLSYKVKDSLGVKVYILAFILFTLSVLGNFTNWPPLLVPLRSVDNFWRRQ